jgi:hypothetical protein
LTEILRKTLLKREVTVEVTAAAAVLKVAFHV